jgi:CRP/FNR family cyclic AMP-dependent transcriptional regulator
MTVSREAVASVPLFASLSKRELKELASTMHEYNFPAGKELMTEGEEGIGFFLIAEGEAMVTLRGSEKRTLRPGDWFGEMALIDGGTRTASVKAVTDLRCFSLTSWEFRPLVYEHPAIAWAVMERLVHRVRDAEANAT